MSATIWVMGARGFVGRHVARHAASKGYRVLGLGHGAWLAEEASSWGVSDWRNGEVDEPNLDLLAAESGVPDGIFHCAGGSSVGVSLQAPFEDFSRSVISTARLLEWLRRHAPACRFVLASSAAVYGGGHDAGIAEQVSGNPASPYGAHKLAAEALLRGAHHSFGIPAGIVRPFSLYGEELRKQLIWDICMKLRGDPALLELGGSGDELRDFIHVSDAAKFFVTVFERLGESAAGLLTANCGSGRGQRVGEIAGTMLAAWGSQAELTFNGNGRPGDPVHLVADAAFARGLGLQSTISFEAGAQRYVEWFRGQFRAA